MEGSAAMRNKADRSAAVRNQAEGSAAMRDQAEWSAAMRNQVEGSASMRNQAEGSAAMGNQMRQERPHLSKTVDASSSQTVKNRFLEEILTCTMLPQRP